MSLLAFLLFTAGDLGGLFLMSHSVSGSHDFLTALERFRRTRTPKGWRTRTLGRGGSPGMGSWSSSTRPIGQPGRLWPSRGLSGHRQCGGAAEPTLGQEACEPVERGESQVDSGLDAASRSSGDMQKELKHQRPGRSGDWNILVRSVRGVHGDVRTGWCRSFRNRDEGLFVISRSGCGGAHERFPFSSMVYQGDLRSGRGDPCRPWVLCLGAWVCQGSGGACPSAGVDSAGTEMRGTNELREADGFTGQCCNRIDSE